MKKSILVLLLGMMCLSAVYGSQLSKYLHKKDEEEKAQQRREWQQDMNFSDFAFRLQRRFVNDHGQRCREYVFRSRSNPYRHGQYIVCDERLREQDSDFFR
ncbi:hypothetical protein [Legionella oakridgensis]|uniref:hypothetical protein n=1 Tax=Legionella oakridgensis TaxID=29423 RepID=UPI0003DE4E6E|nr:hypothetical protein [Legionella oakridgensis]ETO92110.1 hypothetical protein LOR_35c03110 [Legionella oakridgensis RV-2-2007]